MILKKNVGYLDSVIRTIIGAVAIIVGFYLDSYWGLLGLYFVFSGAISFCPVYRIMNKSTMNPDLEREN